jgi:GNAT superfamily N-acetyltransferase
MLWRVRTTLPDQPGTLAVLAQRCGAAGVNILGLQIFPGLDDVTDEIVVSTGEDWSAEQVTALVASAGGTGVVTQPSTAAALEDQPTRYVLAARTVLERPMSFPEVVARLFDAEPEPTDATVVHDTMELAVGDVQVQVHRTAPFTETERARGAAMADLVGDVLERVRAVPVATSGLRRLGTGATPLYGLGRDTVTASVDGTVVGTATVGPERPEEDGAVVRPVDLTVDPAWQRRGIGTRLLLDAARVAGSLGADEVLLTTRPDNQAVLPLVLGAGLRGRIRMAADRLTVRIPVGQLRPSGERSDV